MKFQVLGPLEAQIGVRHVNLGPPKQRTLLAVLLLNAGEVVSYERLIDELWPESPPTSARHSLQVYVSALRKALDPGGNDRLIESRSGGYVLNLLNGELDLDRFRALVEEARSAIGGDPGLVSSRLRDALSLWRGRPLAGLDAEPAARQLMRELDELRLTALEEAIGAELAAGRDRELVPELERLVAENPTRERFTGHLMLALYRAGRQADALAVYQRMRKKLVGELGLEPTLQQKALEAAILRQDESLRADPPALRTRLHLPAPAAPLVGRVDETEEVTQLVATGGVRLVTLTGPGGVGKTRLALAAAERLAERFRDGVYFVDLAPVADQGLVLAHVARTFGVEEAQGRPLRDAVAAFTRERELLLVVDNFEHLLDSGSSLSELLRQSPRLKLLVTSRVRLDLYGEYRYEVPPLALPAANRSSLAEIATCDSVALFLVRGRAALPTFDLTPRNVDAIAALCIDLEGLPLGIELAAARVDSMSPAALRDGLTNRLGLLARGPRDVADRQRSIRATIAWSYQLLSASAQRAFRRLSVFAGGCTLEAASAICDVTPETLASLVASSLLGVAVGVERRFTMLETIREYALEQLRASGEDDELQRRHGDYFAKFAAEADPVEPRALLGLEAELHNFDAALKRLYRGEEPMRAADLALALFPLAERRAHVAQGRAWLEPASNSDQVAAPVHAQALYSAAVLAVMQADWEAASSLLHRALALFRGLEEAEGIGKALGQLAWIAAQQGDHVRAEELALEAVDAARRVDNPTSVVAIGALGVVLFEVGKLEAARAVMTQAITEAEAIGDWRFVAGELSNLAVVDLLEQRFEDALEHASEALRRATALEDVFLSGAARVSIGAALMFLGPLDAAADTLIETLDVFSELGDASACAEIVETLAAVAARAGDLPEAARLVGVAQSLRAHCRAHTDAFERFLWQHVLSAARSELGVIAWDIAAAAASVGSLSDGISAVKNRRSERVLGI